MTGERNKRCPEKRGVQRSYSGKAMRVWKRGHERMTTLESREHIRERQNSSSLGSERRGRSRWDEW